MRHLDVFIAVDTDKDLDLGVVSICPSPNRSNHYAYYFRTPRGEYQLLRELESMTVLEARAFERNELKDLVQTHLGILRPEQWKFYRSRPTIWNDSSVFDPEINNGYWLLAMDSKFED